jgi:uncharacterized transporter YbjL
MAAMTALLRGHPEVALFVALSLGFLLGKRKLGTFSLGTSAGVLLAGVLIGQLHIPIPELVKVVSFALFIFVVGYRVGPPARKSRDASSLGRVGVAAGHFLQSQPSQQAAYRRLERRGPSQASCGLFR